MAYGLFYLLPVALLVALGIVYWLFRQGRVSAGVLWVAIVGGLVTIFAWQAADVLLMHGGDPTAQAPTAAGATQ